MNVLYWKVKEEEEEDKWQSQQTEKQLNDLDKLHM